MSFLILFSLFVYSLSRLSSLKSHNKFIQIIKFFKIILNLDPKFIKTYPPKKKKKKKKKNQTHINNQTQIAKEEEEEDDDEE